MIRGLARILIALASFPAIAAGIAAAGGPATADLNQAAAFYHEARFDSALARLENLRGLAGWRHRDSLVLFQYMGMSSARLGRDSLAVSHFLSLLALDSLFQFARNEDSLVLRDFQAARLERLRRMAPPEPLPPRDSAAATAVAAVTPVIDAPVPAVTAPRDSAPAVAQDPIPAEGLLRPPAFDPLRGLPAEDPAPRMNVALGAIPLGAGWIMRDRMSTGLSLAFIQAGAILLSIYASERQSQYQNGRYGLLSDDRGASENWQLVQRISLTTAVGAYLFSVLASGRK